MNIAIILAGGAGTRVGADRPKQFIEIFGKPILAYTTEIFQSNDRVDAIEIVCHHSWMDYCQEMCDKYDLTKVKWIVHGGETFQESVINGIKYLEENLSVNCSNGEVCLSDNIYIQYGAAPFTSQKIVNSVIDMTEERGSAVTGTPCYQLLGSRDDDSHSMSYVNRDGYIQIACPYGFKFSYLIDVYTRAKDQGLLDKIEPHTTSLMYALGDTINYAYGDQTNIKLTTKEDFELFEGYILAEERRKNMNNEAKELIEFLNLVFPEGLDRIPESKLNQNQKDVWMKKAEKEGYVTLSGRIETEKSIVYYNLSQKGKEIMGRRTSRSSSDSYLKF